MPPLSIVKHFDILANPANRLLTISILAVMNQFRLENGEEALHGRIIVHVAGTAHADQGLRIGQELVAQDATVVVGFQCQLRQHLSQMGLWLHKGNKFTVIDGCREFGQLPKEGVSLVSCARR